MSTLPFFLVFAAPALLLAGAAIGGAATLLPVAFVFGALPLLDQGLGRGRTESRSSASRAWVTDLPLFLWVPVQLTVTALVLGRIAAGGLSLAEAAGLTLSLGVSNGAGINVAHELMHRPRRLDRALAELLMASVSYPHFCVEHVHGHHRNVATPRDPATARLGESVYRFWWRSVGGGVRDAWRIEAERAAGTPARLGLGDARVRQPLLLGVAGVAVTATWGAAGLLAFVAQGVVAFTLLEVVNYLEHYGLLRLEVTPGRYERVQPFHSWNASHRVSNWYLFNLGRHSDHHFLASRPYPSLRHRDEAPQLPAGYATMLLLAAAPPLWFRVMDPRVAAWRARHCAGPRPASPLPKGALP